MNNEFVCIAEFVAKNGQVDNLYAALSSLLEPTRKEAGCLSYELHRSLNNPSLFTMIEKYKNKAAFDFHVNQPYLINFRKIRNELIDSLSANFYKVVEPFFSSIQL